MGHVPYNPRPPPPAPRELLEVMEEPLEVKDEASGVVDVSATSGALPEPLGVVDKSRRSSKLRPVPSHPRLVSHKPPHEEVIGTWPENLENL